jgi:hypothetical protein
VNEAQRQLYFRTWQAAAKAHGWTSKAGILAALQEHQAGHIWESPELNRTPSAIYELALTAAASDGRDVSANDLRHACTAVAVGRQASSKSFSNSDFDKVLALLRVLANPADLANLLAAQDHGQAGERRRHVHAVKQADTFYWQRIARDKFGHADLDRLTLAQLRQLSLTIRNRRQTANKEALIAA